MSKINYWKVMTRKKPMPAQDADDSRFNRVFGTFDLTALGVSATLGVGVYVLAGHVAKLEAGPSVILSFLIAAGASFLAGLCYAEFSSRVPKSGSAYVFTYVAIGEFVAFIIGWNLLLEYIIGSASIAKGLSLYIDSLINNTMKNSFREIAPITATGNFLSTYFDFFAFSCPLLLGLALAFGLRKSAGMNNILCILNLCVVFFVVVVVLIYADFDYWRIDPLTVAPEYKDAVGNGGFFPFGFTGTIKGAATCFFGFVGYDCIATTGEEVRNPRKSVPRAILYSLVIIFVAYFGVSLLTLMWPYYLLDAEAPLPHAFNEKGLTIPKWIVTIGGIVGLVASLFGAMFPLPRILYAMSIDGLIFKAFGVISKRFKTPVVGTLCAAALTSCFAGLFDLAALVDMLSIGVLLAYTVVAISIIILRFSVLDQIPLQNSDGYIETSNLLRPGYTVTVKGFFMQLIRLNSSHQPNSISSTVVGIVILCYCIISLTTALIIVYAWEAIAGGEMWALASLIVLAALLVLFSMLISIQPRQMLISRNKPFMVPFVPFLPTISIFINIYLMLMLDCYTWIRFGIWMIIGLFLYFPYAWYYHNSMLTNKNSKTDENIQEIEKPETPDVKSETIVIENIENVEIIPEMEDKKEPSSPEITIVINNNENQNKESHLVIKILDTVLENEEEEIDKLSQSISQDVTIEIDINLPQLDIIDENEIKSQIDEILERATEIAALKIDNDSKRDSDDENIFHNEKFLTHLSDIIINRNAIESQTLHRRKRNLRNENAGLKQSNSAPNLQDLISNDDNVEDVEHKRNNKIKYDIQTTSYNTELLEKFEEMKRKKMEDSTSRHDEESSSSEEETVNKVEFRAKLEKILSNPPVTRLSLTRPVPLPRTNSKRDEKVPTSSRLPIKKKIDRPITPVSATMQRQRLIFDEVLKSIKKESED